MWIRRVQPLKGWKIASVLLFASLFDSTSPRLGANQRNQPTLNSAALLAISSYLLSQLVVGLMLNPGGILRGVLRLLQNLRAYSLHNPKTTISSNNNLAVYRHHAPPAFYKNIPSGYLALSFPKRSFSPRPWSTPQCRALWEFVLSFFASTFFHLSSPYLRSPTLMIILIIAVSSL